ncbi:hypothetical protein ACFS7Z_02120 [Pontibacter toksunensis]|uniref:Glycosyltransferase involved in cell wall biosynthesis n=1 Tax=Pontibacter toksunensis TaxID=1332631 RepID=A0ABW6BPF5_9BACT
MKKIIIVSPHFPPSNLAAVHRSRLFAKHLPFFGWEPIILTVHHKFYEEAPDWNLNKLVSESLKVEKVSALPVKPVRLLGDIGLRGGLNLFAKLLSLVKKEQPDFIYIPIPSFYAALLGRAIHAVTGVPYGIDYIDPWVHFFPGSEKRFSRHWWSTKFAAYLEPIAVKHAKLITGVAEGYYLPVLERNLHLKKRSVQAYMPYGGEKEDHIALKKLNLRPYLFDKKRGKHIFVYAGAMLPKAYKPLDCILQVIQENEAYFNNTEFHFIGTGKTPNDPEGYNIKDYAIEYNLWEKVIYEYPKRIPYLDVLTHLNVADGVFVLGSTEPHYTPSKVYQGILSEKPVFAVLHEKSSASKVIVESNAGIVLNFAGESDINTIKTTFLQKIKEYQQFANDFDPAQVDHSAFELYSALNVTKVLAEHLDMAIDKK